MRRRLAVPALVAVGALIATACGSVPEEFKEAAAVECPSGSDCFDPPQPAGPGGRVVVDMGEFFFEVKEAEAFEGTVTIVASNIGGSEHNFTIDEAFGDEKQVPVGRNAAPGETVEGELELFAGTFTFYCSVPGHRAQGMEATLEVLPGTGQVPAPSPQESPDEVSPSPTTPIGEEGAATPGEPGASPEGTGVGPSPRSGDELPGETETAP